MRLKKKEVQEREAWARAYFKGGPSVSVPQANDDLFDRFGTRMNLRRMYEIRTEIRKELGFA